MGQLVADNSALVSPRGQTEAIGSPRQVMAQANKQLQAQPSPEAQMGPDVLNPKPVGQNANLQSIGKPSFLQAATSGPSGMPNAASPGLSKAGKLVTLLTSGLKGALAGRAASEQTVAQTGGRRSGGAGMGFQAGVAQPYQQAEMGQELQQKQAQTELTKQQASMVQTPYGLLPAALAKVILPAAIRGEATEGAATTRAGAAEKVAQTGATSRENVAKINQGQGVPVDPNVAQMVGMPELANIPAGRGTWTNINKALEAKGYRVQDMGKNGEDENSGMWLMDRGGNRIKQVSPNSITFQRGASFAQNRPEVVTDPNDPGYAYYTTAAKAMDQNLPSPLGAGTVAARREATSEVPTKIGDQKVAFNTAMQHADLLQKAFDAVGNSDVRTWNSIKNRAKTEFGWSEPPTAALIAGAYAREITKMLAANHMTDAEIGSSGATLPPNASPAQMKAALNAYKSLAQSKLTMLNQQAQSSRTQTRGQAPVNTAADPLGIR